MTRLDDLDLRQAIPHEEFDYALLSDVLSDYSNVRTKIGRLLDSGLIQRVKKGLYVFAPEYNRVPVCKEVLANQIYGPSCVSLEYALSFHGFIPERVEIVTSVTPKRDKEFDTPLGRFTYRYLAPEKYPHGIEQVWIDETHPVLMASPEKALCDYLVLNKISSITDGAEARRFLEEDLRIDAENLARLNVKELLKLNRSYRSKSVDAILVAL